MAEQSASGTPVVTPGTNGHDWAFSWANGSIAATLFQSTKGIQDMLSAGISNGSINSDSTVTINSDGTFTLHISESVSVLFFTQIVTVNCTGSLAASADGKSTVFQLTNGTVDAGGHASQAQVVSALQTQVAAWQTQAQKEPLQAKPSAHELK